MEKRKLGTTNLSIAPIVFGGNVFGWSIDEKQSFAVLDAFVDLGFNAIDTADVYSAWVEGNKGGESETILGRWLKARPGMKDKVTIFTKVGYDVGVPDQKGLSPRWINIAIDKSLQRLGLEHIDLYFSHRPDPATPVEETLKTYQDLQKAGKIGAIGLSGATAAELQHALDVSKKESLPAYEVLQPEYNLYDHILYPKDLRELCQRESIGVVTYSSLAGGFLSGKYRSENDFAKSQARGKRMSKYLNDRGLAVLKVLDEVAAGHNATQSEVALAWLIAQPSVTAPIASTTSIEQLKSFARAVSLKLTADELAALAAVAE